MTIITNYTKHKCAHRQEKNLGQVNLGWDFLIYAWSQVSTDNNKQGCLLI